MIFLSALIAYLPIYAVKPFQKKTFIVRNIKYVEVRHFQSYGQWVKVIGVGVAYSVKHLEITIFKFPSTIEYDQSVSEVCGDVPLRYSENVILKQSTLTHIVFSL